MEKVLVTGADGFIGRGIVRRLSSVGFEVVASCLYKSEYLNELDKVKTIESDIFCVEDPYNFYNQPDVLVHCAWRDGFKHNSLSHINDLPKHYNFINSLVESGIKKIVVLGSMHEIGFYEGCIDESTPSNPMSLYGISKNSLRQMCELAVKGTDTKLQWIRGFYIVENTDYGCSIFSKLMKASKEGKATFPFTSGINQFDFIDYDVFVNQVVAVVKNNKTFGIINCCSGRPMKLSDRVEKFIQDNNLNIKLDYGAFPDRPYDSLAIWGENKKICKILMENENEK